MGWRGYAAPARSQLSMAPGEGQSVSLVELGEGSCPGVGKVTETLFLGDLAHMMRGKAGTGRHKIGRLSGLEGSGHAGPDCGGGLGFVPARPQTCQNVP